MKKEMKRSGKRQRKRESLLVGAIVFGFSAAMVLSGVWMYGIDASESGGFGGGGGGYSSAGSVSSTDQEDDSGITVGSAKEASIDPADSSEEKTTEETPKEPSDSGTESSGSSTAQQPAEIDKTEQEIESGGDAYGFQYGKRNRISQSPSYFRFTSENYSFWCDIPNHFYRIEGTNIWRASDDTAQMELIAYVNESGLTPKQALDQYIAEIGGSVFYSDTGTDWFAVSLSRDGIEYYEKCFVDDYIRAFEFICPHEYVDIYGKYIDYIEKHFKRL